MIKIIICPLMVFQFVYHNSISWIHTRIVTFILTSSAAILRIVSSWKKNPNSYQARANILNVDPKGGANIFQFWPQWPWFWPSVFSLVLHLHPRPTPSSSISHSMTSTHISIAVARRNLVWKLTSRNWIGSCWR